MSIAVAFIIATLADIVTTNLVLSKGGRELNGVVVWFMGRLGRFWWLPKAAVAAAFFWALDAWPDNDALRYGVGVGGHCHGSGRSEKLRDLSSDVTSQKSI